MLRLVVILLVLANAGYFAWTQGMLAPLGLSTQVQSESHRLQEQVQPEAIRLLNAPRTDTASRTPPTVQAAAPVETPAAQTAVPVAAPPATACWRVGGYTPAQADALRQALQGQPALAGLWQLDEAQTSGRWIVYMGKLNDELMARKKTELREMNVEFREIRGGALGPALALGTFSTEAAAQQGLAIVTRKGVRTARVVQERPEVRGQLLRLTRVDSALKAQLESLKPQLEGRVLQACR